MDDAKQSTDAQRRPTADRPLAGLTILVVEDSRYASEALRLLCLRSGARIRRADCLTSARRHLQVYRPSVAIVDLGLPDGSGLDLIRNMATATPRIGIILGMSGDDTAGPAARDAGADGFLVKPLGSLAAFQHAILSRLPADRRPNCPRPVREDHVIPDPLALQDDLHLVVDILADQPGQRRLNYVAQFLHGIARSAEDTDLGDLASVLARPDSDPAQVAALLRQRLPQQKAI